MRWRVRLGYPLATAVLWFSRPAPRSILLGGLVGALGLLIRTYAAGYLHKQEVLTVTGPYGYTRNPLYLGSAIMACGAAIAMRSWVSATLLLLYFAVFYSMVMRREEKELHARHGAVFEDYARTVPLFIPRLRPAKVSDGTSGGFSFEQYRKNHEWQAALGFLLFLAALSLIWHFSPALKLYLLRQSRIARVVQDLGGRKHWPPSKESFCAAHPPKAPPRSMSMVLPPGDTTNSKSPWPTSSTLSTASGVAGGVMRFSATLRVFRCGRFGETGRTNAFP
jgi:hypothetical protein